MKVLVFVSKWIGKKCLNTLFEDFNDDEYLFVVSGLNSGEIIKYIKHNNHEYVMLDKQSIGFIKSQEPHHYDWLLNLWGDYIFDEHILLKAKKSLNIHPSLLPFGRGMDPVVWAIRYGHPAGVALHQITPGIDEGPIIYQEEVEYSFPTTGKNLYDKVVERCWIVFNENWVDIRNSNIKPEPQSFNSDTHKRIDLIKDQLISLDDNELYRDLFMRILAYDFGNDYCASAQYGDKTYSIRIVIKEKFQGDDNV